MAACDSTLFSHSRASTTKEGESSSGSLATPNSATRDRTTSKDESSCIIRTGPYERFERSFLRKAMPVGTLLGDPAQQ